MKPETIPGDDWVYLVFGLLLCTALALGHRPLLLEEEEGERRGGEVQDAR